VLLPWVPNVQELWYAAACALAAHLQQSCVYGSLTLVHVPGLSVYGEELRMPTGFPRPMSTDTSVCPNGRLAYTAVIGDASTTTWQTYGYSDWAVIDGFKVIAPAFAQAFPDRVPRPSLFNPAAIGIDIPNLTNDPVSYVALQIVQKVNGLSPSRVQLQLDDINANLALQEVKNFAPQYSNLVVWQANKHAGTGAGVQWRRCRYVRNGWTELSVLPASPKWLAKRGRLCGGLVGRCR